MIIHLELSTGASGDKILGALLELCEALGVADFGQLQQMATALLPNSIIRREQVLRAGIQATHISVDESPASTHHRHWRDIRAMIDVAAQNRALSQKAAHRATSCFALLAQAEAQAHGVEVEAVHFHEVGAADSIVDIVGSCFLLAALAPAAMYATPMALGNGTVDCEHGQMPVPAPATARILATPRTDGIGQSGTGGIPVYASIHDGELTTPTGAALIHSFVDSFAPLPCCKPVALGHGAGSRELSGTANIVRALAAEKSPLAGLGNNAGEKTAGKNPLADPNGADLDGAGLDKAGLNGFVIEGVALLETNIDHRTPEELAFICEHLFSQGALDVWQEAIHMKKGRLALKLLVLCSADRAQEFAAAIIAQTGSLGVRSSYVERTVIPRRVVELDTPYGTLPYKAAEVGPPLARQFLRPESDAVAAVAQNLNKDYHELYQELANQDFIE
ncbi:MAG: nickel pincer cofactor biosynthesis protein LarC [Coriobacteriales bacterium]|jgi:uncharacterized protein (TIGR00299 family) protein|nr:nickel pincer cofactor biosynthesis protein LarC [Coriobacteriales bacterium]